MKVVGRTHPAPTGARGEKRSRGYARRHLGQTSFGRGFNSPRLHHPADDVPAPEDNRVSRTIYRVEAGSSGEQPRGAVSRGDTRQPRRRALQWVLMGIVVVILAMIVAIVILDAAEGEAAGAPGQPSSTAMYPQPTVATASATNVAYAATGYGQLVK
jgi:hypothetical protein